MNKNEKLISEIAEEMANKVSGDRLRTISRVYQSKEMIRTQKERIISECLPHARIAVKYMADAVDKALRYAEWRKYDERQAYLCFQGLIPEDRNNVMDETAHLMSSANNAARLTESLNRINNKTGKEAAGDESNNS